ncbi:type II toxin-antitoxin system RelE/ParE family toxin [Asticcacaulis sp. AC466]|uniref:type II toxin-antitoxin system RelE/ParE family toxin n=1 Tax=Asticcacaulis sp. AC466 TaxID=1282362 RepID=UPI0009E06D5C|nr:type II toxin-antitoxin system mRNA interferase toxin, RelE/StbE family [Asticcacaulis sp. AC466]
MKLDWTPLALEDRINTFNHIAEESVQIAVKIDDAIDAQTERLVDFPESGRPGRFPGTRELIVTGYPFTVVYRIVEDTIRIIRVLHQAQQWPDDLPH